MPYDIAHRFRYFIIIPLFSLSLFSCKKSQSESGKTRAGLIVGVWKIGAVQYSPAYDYYGDGNKVTDGFSIRPDCERDNLIRFKADGTWENDENTIKCDDSDSQIVDTGTWKLKDNDQTLFLSEDGGDDYTIVQLDASKMKITQDFEEDGKNYNVVMTLDRQ